MKKKKIAKMLSSPKVLNDLTSLKFIEKFLKKKRKYIFKIPPQRNPVILLASGGLDTTVTAEILMKEYKLKIYPLYINRGHKRVKKELNSVNYFYKHYFPQKYPELCAPPSIVYANIPPKPIRWEITKHSNERNPNINKQLIGIPFYSTLLSAFGAQFAYYLQITKNIKIRTIFCGFIISDGEVFAEETLTALRSSMLNLCITNRDFSWQFTSLPLEKELGFYWDKTDLIQWGNSNGLPLEKTWTCNGDVSKYQCGECIGCAARKEAFKKADIPDPTKYGRNLLENKILNIRIFIGKTIKILKKKSIRG